MKKRLMIAGVLALVIGLGFSSQSDAASQNSQKTYVALGDSVASGDGLGNYSDIACKRSYSGYPSLVANRNNLKLQNYSCSGAQIRAGITSAQTNSSGGITAASQLDTAFANGIPNVMTITIGANNLRWYDFFQYCQTYGCTGSRFYQYFGSVGTTALRGVVQAELPYTLSKINYLASRQGIKAPTIYLTGYYSPLSTNTSCLGTNAITPAQASWFQYQVSALNNVIQRTANLYGNVRYVPIDFSGHELCSKSPWVQSFSDAAPIHPNTIGQEKITDAISAAMKR